MSIPSTFAPISPNDFTLTPVIVNKRFELTSTSLATTASGYLLVDGLYTTIKTPIGAPQAENDPTNSIDKSYKAVVWQSINHMYYKNPYNPMETFEHANRRYTFKELHQTASILSIPYMDYGDQIKPWSFEYTGSTFNFKDDGNGNLFDNSINTGSFTARHAVIGYWGFNDVFRKFRRGYGTIDKGLIKFTSHIFEPDIDCGVKGVFFEPGVMINSTSSGMQATFNNSGYILTHNRPEFNFASEEDFTISFWINIPPSQSFYAENYSSIISKKGAIYKQVFGDEEKYNANGLLVSTPHTSQSLQNQKTDIFSYDISLITSGSNANKINFKRSDGISTLSLVSSTVLNPNTYYNICVTKSGSLVTLYKNGSAEASGSDPTIHPINSNLILFGSNNLDYEYGFSGSLDEIRMYDYACNQSEILTLSDNTTSALYQTAWVGNIFYRKGIVVLTPFDPKYKQAFSDANLKIHYRGTHVIYQYEALCRIKAGAFNNTRNPTALVSPTSDLYSNDFTSSLYPYATSIGLYDDKGSLLAVAKMGQALQMRNDVNLNLLVTWDC